jgi:hypothetical protein
MVSVARQLGGPNPYGERSYQKARRRMLARRERCWACGGQATSLDHQPPIALHSRPHREGSGCCRLIPACAMCQARQGAELSNAVQMTPASAASTVVEPERSPGPGDAMWDVPWLEVLRELPAEAVWPRFMTAPHPSAVGSYGLDAVRWVEAEVGPLRWWQRLWITRQLEHDERGRLCWLTVIPTTARQNGKSVGLRAIATWRIHAAALFGERQLVLHCARDVPVMRNIVLPSIVWAMERGYEVRRQNGNESIITPDGSSWLGRGKDSIYGYSASMAMIDECWGVNPETVEDGVEPTMLERVSPQILLTSTAHRKATLLLPLRRLIALEELAVPSSTLLLEWSADRGADITDRGQWREASPHWSEGRERLLEERMKRVQRGETMDAAEADPVESWRAQYGNVWPLELAPPTYGERLLPDGLWACRREPGFDEVLPTWVAVEDNFGYGAAVAAVVRQGDRFEVDGWLCSSWSSAIGDALALVAARPGSRLIVGASLASSTSTLSPPPAKAGAVETRVGLPLLRELAAAGRLVHEETPALDEQIEDCRVREINGGLALVSGVRSDLLRAAVWALRAAQKPPALPTIR